MSATTDFLAPTKETPQLPLFRSFLVRIFWRVYTQHLTQSGRWFLWPSLAFLTYGTLSLDLQTFIPFCFAVALWGMALLCRLLYRPRTQLRAEHAVRVCAGELLPVELELTPAHADFPVVVLPHRLPESVDCVPREGMEAGVLEAGKPARVSLALRPRQRGVFELHGFRVESDFPFGLLRARQTFETTSQLLVYPRFQRLARISIPSGRRYQPGGIALASHIGESFEYIGNREFAEGDNVRDIDWRATARLARPVVREYREEYFLRVAVILDTHVPVDVGAKIRAARTADFERAVSVCAAVSDCMARQEHLVDIFAAGESLYHLTAGRGLAYLDQILDILACVESSAQMPFATLHAEMIEHVQKLTTVVCIFLDWDEARRNFTEELRALGTAVKVIVVRESAPTLNVLEDSASYGRIPIVSEADFERGLEEL